MEVPENLRARIENLSRDGKKEILKDFGRFRDVHELEDRVHKEERKDWEAEVENAETRQDIIPPE